jgi:hypothetical protein
MSEASGYAFAISMAVAATMVAGFALATLVTVSGVLADTNARLRGPTSDWPTGTPSSRTPPGSAPGGGSATPRRKSSRPASACVVSRINSGVGRPVQWVP